MKGMIKFSLSYINLFYRLVVHVDVSVFTAVIGLQVRWFWYEFIFKVRSNFFFKGELKNPKEAVSKFGSFSATLENGIQLSLSYYGPTGETAGKVSK